MLESMDVFTCRECECEFAVLDSENYERIVCPVCGCVLKNGAKIARDIYYWCSECGCSFRADREPKFCPSCGSEEILVDC